MTQQDVFGKPSVRSRKAYPVLMVLQSDTSSDRRRLIAPMMLSSTHSTPPPSRAVPKVVFGDRSYAVVLTQIVSIESRILRDRNGSIAAFRDDIARALERLFFGV